MLGATLILLFQVAAGDAAPAASPPAVAAVDTPVAVAAPAEKKAQPKLVCWTENVTGSRARKQKVCRTEAYVRAGDEARQDFKNYQDKASAGGPLGIKPGGG